MNYYVLSLNGHDSYIPIWFESNCSKEEFENAVKKVTKDIIAHELDNMENFIDGHTIVDNYRDDSGIDRLKDGMCKCGFMMIKPDLEIDVGGECIYSKRGNKPSIYSDEDWIRILEHNQTVRDNDIKRSKE